MENASELGERLYMLRTRKGETQEVTAESIGISHVSLGRYESGARQPSADVLLKMANHFDVSVDYLVGNMQDDEAGDDRDLWELREAARRDPDRKALLQLAKNGTAKDVRQAVALIDALRATNPDFYDGDDPA